MTHGVLGLEPGRRQFLSNQLGPAVAGGRFIQDASADREPALVDVPLGFRDPQRLLLMALLVLHHGLADRGPKRGDLGHHAAQLLGLVAVEQSRLEPVRRQVLLPAPDDGPGQPADEPLTVSVASNIFRLGDLEGFIKPAVGQRTFRLSDSQD